MNNNNIVFIKQKDYKLIRSIGQGGLGKAILIEDETINEQFVCKKYSPLYEDIREEYFENFVREIKILYLINHRNIVRVFNYYLYPIKFTGYILMEFIDGQEIHNFIESNPEKINDIFVQTINGFKYLEKNDVLHRDIRPQNILVSHEGIVKIIDFGFGKKIKFGDDFNKSISLYWAFSPPLEFEEKLYDFRTEIYFVGKLFEKFIRDNHIESFAYNDVLVKMITPKNIDRIKSFFDVSREIEGTNSLETNFSNEDINSYRFFAQGISEITSKFYEESEYIDDIDLIISSLEEVYSNSILEEYIQNNNKLISCFIKGNFSYIDRYGFETSVLRNFLTLLRGQPNEMRKIILNHLWNRFDTVEREFREPNYDEELPF
ncbi:MAG: protein kinase family protein [Bacteroidota bacterium]